MILASRKVAAACVAVALAGGIGVGGATGAKRHTHGALLRAAAQYIGVSKAELAKAARSGQTLAAVATAHGKTVDGLEAAVLAAVKAKLDAAVAAGKINAAQEQTKLARAQQFIERLVNAKLSPGAGRHHGEARLLKLAAAYVGITPKALAAELKAGRSLAQVATAHGKTAAGLKQALLAPLKAKLDKALASGRITTAQAQARLDKVSARLDQLINKTK